MDLVWVINVLIILLIFYSFWFKEILDEKKKFRCLRCGDCCKLKVKLNQEDIKRLKKAGKKYSLDKKGFLKRINGHCIFLGMKNGIAECEIEKIKPEICRNYPKKRGLLFNRRDHRCRSCWAKLSQE